MPGTGRAVLVTKSADSYHEIDQLIADVGLDPRADSRPSLYESFHSGTVPEITATALRVEQISHQHHVFRFAGLDHLAAYVTTSPKYRLPALNRMPIPVAGLPVAFYKDANIRNFLLTDGNVAIIDFDDLTLA